MALVPQLRAHDRDDPDPGPAERSARDRAVADPPHRGDRDDAASHGAVLGGAALAFWFSRLATIEVPWRYVVAFALACTGVVAWEAGEFAVDQLVGTALQEGNLDTMTDLLLSVCGAAGYLSLALTGWRGRGGR